MRQKIGINAKAPLGKPSGRRSVGDSVNDSSFLVIIMTKAGSPRWRGTYAIWRWNVPVLSFTGWGWEKLVLLVHNSSVLLQQCDGVGVLQDG